MGDIGIVNFMAIPSSLFNLDLNGVDQWFITFFCGRNLQNQLAIAFTKFKFLAIIVMVASLLLANTLIFSTIKGNRIETDSSKKEYKLLIQGPLLFS